MRAAIAVVVLLVAGCATDPFQKYLSQFPEAKSSYDRDLRIFDYYAAEAYGFEYYVSRQHIIVVIQNDFGWPKREAAAVSLSAEQSQELFSIIEAIPLESLNEKYINPAVHDGLQMVFDFTLPTRAPKKIMLANIRQDDLFRLADAINRLVPKQFALRQPRASTSGNTIYLR